MFPSSHKTYIRSFYKKILSEASIFFDDRTRLYITSRARKTFHEYKTCHDIERIKYKIREGRKHLHRLEKANRGHDKSALKILREAYGLKGKTRHGLIYPYLNGHQHEDVQIHFEPFVAHAPRTAPPPLLCPPLRALITQHLGKNVEPELPVPQYKPLHVGRKANLLWRHRSMLLDRVQVPLPFEIICELEMKAGAPKSHPLACATRLTGGPQWNDFYMPIQPAVNMLGHLEPQIPSKRLLPPKSHSLLSIRARYKMTESPYSTYKPSLLEYLEKNDENKQDEVKSVSKIDCYNSRKKKRLYRRLLQHVPCINMFSANQMWKEGIKYNVFKSNWAPRAVNEILEDVPDEKVICATLVSSRINKKKRS
ncbi:MAG: hypothetical protein EXX96DRAFT_385627 [Benjaminiella poitrasii]|nr:MAG: hypothetical protein EXX96DRAFT_385627 [Benjaminiella poitrasii]